MIYCWEGYLINIWTQGVCRNFVEMFKYYQYMVVMSPTYFLYKSIYFLLLTVFSSLLGSKYKETSPWDALVCRPQPFYDYWWQNIFLAKKLFLLLHLSFVFLLVIFLNPGNIVGIIMLFHFANVCSTT